MKTYDMIPFHHYETVHAIALRDHDFAPDHSDRLYMQRQSLSCYRAAR